MVSWLVKAWPVGRGSVDRKMVRRSVSRSVSVTPRTCGSWSVGRLVEGLSVGRQSVGRMLVGQSVSRSVGWLVGRSVCRSVGRSVPPLRFWRFRHFASSFFITAPAQSYATDAVVYTGLPTAPALHITAPAQHPRLQPVRVSGLVVLPCKTHII